MNGAMPAPELPLRDIHLPEPIVWWPPAPGWWLLAALCLLLLIFGIIRLRRRRLRGRLPRSARKALKSLAAQYRQDEDGAKLARELSVLMRRIAVTLYPRREVARLTGEAWLEFLDRPLRGTKEPEAFRSGIGRVLLEAPYNPRCQVDGKALLKLTERWIAAATREASHG